MSPISPRVYIWSQFGLFAWAFEGQNTCSESLPTGHDRTWSKERDGIMLAPLALCHPDFFTARLSTVAKLWWSSFGGTHSSLYSMVTVENQTRMWSNLPWVRLSPPPSGIFRPGNVPIRTGWSAGSQEASCPSPRLEVPECGTFRAWPLQPLLLPSVRSR